MNGDRNDDHHRDLDTTVHCHFKHIPSNEAARQIAANIKTFTKLKEFDKTGLEACGYNGNDDHRIILTRRVANYVRDNLNDILGNTYFSVWFTICSNPLHSLFPRTLVETENKINKPSYYEASCRFGSLRSYDKFYSHCSFDNKILQISFRNVRKQPDSLCIELDNKQQIIISIDSIQKKNILVNKNRLDVGVFVLLPLKYAPHIFQLESSHSDDEDNNNQQIKQIRICDDENSSDLIKTIALCSDLVLYFEASKNLPWFFLSYLMGDRSDRFEINFSSFKYSNWSDEKSNRRTPDPFNYQNASFQDRYALKMLTSRGYVFRDKWATSTDAELKWNEWKNNERNSLCSYAAERLHEDHGYDLRRTTSDYIESRKNSSESDSNTNEQTISVDQKQRIQIAVCTLTPLRLIFQPLELTSGSRALRNKKLGGPDRFLLVHFRDEDNRELRTSNRNIKQKLKNMMLNGIPALGRIFKFLGASTGQMKEMAFWFIDLPSNLKDMTDAHNLLGDFRDIKNIATYIARVGQYFSTTWPVGIQLTEVKSKNDIHSNNKQYCVLRIPDVERDKRKFTDGIGKISWGLAGRVAQKMKIPLYSKEDIPSAFQVRIAGCKGMLAIDPESTLNDYYIQYRESMEKFRSDDWNLEICEFSRPITLTFNNQVIRLLSDLKNPDSVFHTYQTLGLKNWRHPEEQQPSIIDIALQKHSSYAISKDNLLKNRIPVPPEEGRNLFGVVDETENLQYGECFIQYSSLELTNNGQRRYHVVTGTVLVTKNPCMWPGDFRRLTAVRNSKLEECMRDVIVFPINGHRPHPNEISGSDLDGDQYWVYWGDRLKIENNAEPLSYESATKAEVSLITQEIIVNHIVETFGAGGIVGMIANTHTVVADRAPKNSFSDPCKELAELFSIAIDSPKTGKIIDKKEIIPYQRKWCREWPLFMLKIGEPQYESSSILEKLFINAKESHFKFKEAPMINMFPQRKKPIKGASLGEIEDEGFKRWLEGNIYEESNNPKKGQKKKRIDPTEKNDLPIDPPSTPPQKEKKPSKASITTNETPQLDNKKPANKPSEETTIKKTNTTHERTKKSLPTDNPTALVNSDFVSSTNSASASSASSLSSFTPLVIDQCRPEFIMDVNAKTTAATVVQFVPDNRSRYTVSLKNERTDDLNRDQIITKLMSYIEDQNVFKKKPSVYNQTQHGSLYLIIFYGHIYFIEQTPFPQKLGDLEKLINEKNDQVIRFDPANIDELKFEKTKYSTTNKNTMDYEFDCCLTSPPSQCISLLYDSSKKLRRIRVYHIWSKCYARQPKLTADSLYEIRSIITHESGSPEFCDIIASVFKAPQSTELLNGRKPYIQIDRNLLRSSVIPISLKVIEREQPTEISYPTSEAFYREVKYVSIDEQQEKPQIRSTLEYHVSPINKDKAILEQICDSALSPVENTSSDRRYSTSSTASSISSLQFGFPMSKNNDFNLFFKKS